MRIVKIGALFVVLTGAAAMLAGCANHPTAAKRQADSLKADEICRSGYVVTSGRDSVYTGCQPQ